MTKVQVIISQVRLDGITYRKGQFMDVSMEKAVSMGTSVKICPEAKPIDTQAPESPEPMKQGVAAPETGIKKAVPLGKPAPITKPKNKPK